MQIVIDIPETHYNYIRRYQSMSYFGTEAVIHAITNGTVLPKHGRLIDADKLWDAYHDLDYDFYEALDVAPTLLEATEEHE